MGTKFNIFCFSKLIIVILISSANIFSMERMQQIYRHLTGSTPEQKVTTVPELTAENIKKYPQYKDQFIKDLEQHFIEYVGKDMKKQKFEAVDALVRKYKPDIFDKLGPLVIKYFDQIDDLFLLDFIQKISSNFSKISYMVINELLIQSRFWDTIAELLLATPENQFTGFSHIVRFLNIITILDLENLSETFKQRYRAVLELVKKKATDKTSKYPIGNLDILYPHLDIAEKIQVDFNLLKSLDIDPEKLDLKLTTASLIENLPKITEAKKLLQSKFRDLKNIKFDSIIALIQKNLEMTGKESSTKHHLLSNIETVFKIYEKYPELGQPEVKNFLLNIYKKEKEEQSKGNYVFFHGRNKDIRFAGEIFKELWQIINNKKVSNDFVFARFIPLKKVTSERQDQLFMNHALFGNVHETTMASTISQYWLQNYSLFQGTQESNPFNILNIFKLFNLEKYYLKYEKELENLKRIHDNLSKYGEILLISIPKNKINFVKPVHPGGSEAFVAIDGKLTKNSKEMLDALMQNPRSIEITDNPFDKTSDFLEWALPLTKEYALDPFNGPRFYSFYSMDKNKKQEYEKLKQEIFEKIKKDILAEKQSEIEKAIKYYQPASKL